MIDSSSQHESCIKSCLGCMGRFILAIVTLVIVFLLSRDYFTEKYLRDAESLYNSNVEVFNQTIPYYDNEAMLKAGNEQLWNQLQAIGVESYEDYSVNDAYPVKVFWMKDQLWLTDQLVGLVYAERGSTIPRWIYVRNFSGNWFSCHSLENI